MSKKTGREIPTSDTVLQVPLADEDALRLRAKANRAGCTPGQLLRQGIDWLVDLADADLGRVFRHIRDPSRLHGKRQLGSKEKKPLPAVLLRPARMVALIEVARSLRAAARPTGGRSLPLWEDRLGLGVSPDPDRPTLTARLTRVAAQWAIESLQVDNIQTGGPSSRQGGQLFEKPAGEERGGRRVGIFITRAAKQRISKRASQFGWPAANLARLAVHNLIEYIERRPAEALRYVQEGRGYYQPPNRGKKHHYSYQIVVGLETRKLIKYVPKILRSVWEGPPPGQCAEENVIAEGRFSESEAPGDEAPGDEALEGEAPERSDSEATRQKPTQKRVMQAAGRWAIEAPDLGVSVLEDGDLL